MPEFTYTLNDRLQEQVHDKNVNFYICLLPYSVQSYYASSGFSRKLARIQGSEKSSEKAGLGLDRGSTLSRQGLRGII